YLPAIMLQVGRVLRRFHGLDRPLDRVHADIGVEEASRRHALFDRVLDHGEEAVPKAIQIQEDDRLGVQVQPLPRQQFDHFLQRADAAGATTTTSDSSYISCLRSCREVTTIVSTSSKRRSRLRRKAGMMPTTRPPAAWAARAEAPISPTPPPP